MLKKVQIYKALDIEIKKQKGPIPVKEAYKGHHSLKEELSQPGMTLVGEVAGGNPLRGQVRESYRASTHAKSLVDNGARAVSVATDRFLYYGEDKHLGEVRNVVKVPVLRRDFIFEEYQIEESKILGADAIYLLAALLEPERLAALLKLARSKGLDVVVEVASEADLDRAVKAGADIVCVVGRDLDTWQPSWDLAMDLLARIPSKQCLRMVEAGIDTLDQLTHLEDLGVHGVIIGDALLDEFYPGKRLAQIRAGLESARKPPRPKAKPKAEPSPEVAPETPVAEPPAKPAKSAKKSKVAEAPAPEPEAPKAGKKVASPAEAPSMKPPKKAAKPSSETVETAQAPAARPKSAEGSKGSKTKAAPKAKGAVVATPEPAAEPSPAKKPAKKAPATQGSSTAAAKPDSKAPAKASAKPAGKPAAKAAPAEPAKEPTKAPSKPASKPAKHAPEAAPKPAKKAVEKPAEAKAPAKKSSKK